MDPESTDELSRHVEFYNSLPRVDQLARTIAQQEAYMMRHFGRIRVD